MLWLVRGHAQAARVSFELLPLHASWLNQIELWFSVPERQCLKRASLAAFDAMRSAGPSSGSWPMVATKTTPSTEMVPLGSVLRRSCHAEAATGAKAHHVLTVPSTSPHLIPAGRPRALHGARRELPPFG